MHTLSWFEKRLDGKRPTTWHHFVCRWFGHRWWFDAYWHKLAKFDSGCYQRGNCRPSDDILALGKRRVCCRCGHHELVVEKWAICPLPPLEA
jgi:hypothetical protein